MEPYRGGAAGRLAEAHRRGAAFPRGAVTIGRAMSIPDDPGWRCVRDVSDGFDTGLPGGIRRG
jgi:hypothetical protein